MKYYKKELLSNRLMLPAGKGVKFEPVGTDTGVIATEDPGLSAELDKAAAARRGGVVEITEQIYQELKKNPPVVPSRMKSLNAQSIRQLLGSQKRAGSAAAAAADAAKHQPSAPMEVPDGKGLVTISSRRKLAELQNEPVKAAEAQGAKAPVPQVAKAPAPAAPAHKPSVQKSSPVPAPAKTTAAPTPAPPKSGAD